MIRLEHEPLRAHTTFRIGGPARYYLVPENEEEIQEALDFARGGGYSFYIIGKGSNILFCDEGYDGVIIEIGRGFDHIWCREDGLVTAQAGITMSSMAAKLAAKGLTGFEFASGIPGTLGGGIAMNAGAYGGEIKDCIRKVKVLTPEGEIRVLEKDELQLGYRTSVIQKRSYLVLEGEFGFQKGQPGEIQARMRELNQRRRDKQPLEYPSAGSTFKRPAGHFAGGLIEQCGLKGTTVGGAQVSEKHAGFVINTGQATCQDILTLIRLVRDRVFQQTGVRLEPEVRLLGCTLEEP